MTYTHIETIELASSQSSITFSSIPQDYDDLVVKMSFRHDITQDYLLMRFNNSGSNFSSIVLFGNNSGVFTTPRTNDNVTVSVNPSNSTADTFSNVEIYISNYKISQAKSISADMVFENNSSSNYAIQIFAGLWNNTAALTSVGFVSNGNFVADSTMSLYGVTAGGDGTVTTS